MKRILSLMAMLLVAGVMVSFGQTITGTPHDFDDVADTWNSASTNKMCGPCHATHNADAADGPMWSHDNNTAQASYVPYGTTLAGTTVGAPNAESMACLSCHDGATALDAHDYGDGTGTEVMNDINTAYTLGTTLTGTHPVSVAYTAGTAGLRATTFDPTFAGASTIADLLVSGNIECGSCHDPHNNVNGDFLLKTNANSELCLGCHNK